MYNVDTGKLLNRECSLALSGVLRKVQASDPDLHAQFIMSNCKVALRYLQHIHQIGLDGYSPIAVSLFRTYYEIVCSTMYLAEHKEELDDFLNFGLCMYYEILQDQKLKGKLLKEFLPGHKELRDHFQAKKKMREGKLPSWHGMSIENLGASVGMEQYTDQQLVRSQYSRASKMLHGDSLLTLLAYNFEHGSDPVPFAPPMEVFRRDAVGGACPLFIALLASVDVGLMIGFKDELDRLNAVWQRVWMESTGVNPQDIIDNLSKKDSPVKTAE